MHMSVDKETREGLRHIRDEADALLESLELSQDKGFMDSLKRSEEQVRRRDFADWNDLQDPTDA